MADKGKKGSAKPAKTSAGAGRALIFDFDGLILDTEWIEFQAWQRIFSTLGLGLEPLEWARAVGSPEIWDVRKDLEQRLGRTVDWAPLDADREKHHRELSSGLAVLPGVRELMVEGAALGWRIGVASNSSQRWVFGNLRRCGLDAWVETLRTRDNVPALKPAPDAYLLACQDLGADPARSLAFEDSAPGVAAALGAGLHVVAVPNRITQHHDLGSAHQVLKSLGGFRLPL
ncbi:MAG TPA: HAD-IA family hydrolase [bacterium]|jgi:HAD superfamily hydrolase (TIGR01509 family)|nr:HAD-IA family hydrolase [bacterium]